eukprot:CAMPEP_0195305366 /NCGR_PEP_ID=MMETSP0707-20130614/36159_1 /TAXON_ID=33640 /ORGANISM="Asterionellopsis glacialis, Strain CCMP134" /LENGTH=344 /DNA_ID=CAMNT_0040369463 /DNA_START=98 /DNA_END=1132 /DNA_ORIENTATION=+
MKIQDRLKPDTTIKCVYSDIKDIQNKNMKRSNDPEYIIAYWSIRGLAAPLRMMLAAAKVNHWVVMYDVSETPTGGWNKAAYETDKAWLKKEYNPFMNLPFLVDCRKKEKRIDNNKIQDSNIDTNDRKKQHDDHDDRVIAQTNAIFTYLGRKLNMMGNSVEEESRCEELLCEIMDLRNVMVGFAYKSNVDECEQDAIQLLQTCNRHLEKFEAHLQQKTGKPGYLVGERLSAPDFHLYEMLDQLDGLCRTFESVSKGWRLSFPHLVTFQGKFRSLEDNQDYFGRNSPALPYNNPYARFGSDPETLGKYKRGQNAPWRAQASVEVTHVVKRSTTTAFALGNKRKHYS